MTAEPSESGPRRSLAREEWPLDAEDALHGHDRERDRRTQRVRQSIDDPGHRADGRGHVQGEAQTDEQSDPSGDGSHAAALDGRARAGVIDDRTPEVPAVTSIGVRRRPVRDTYDAPWLAAPPLL